MIYEDMELFRILTYGRYAPAKPVCLAILRYAQANDLKALCACIP
jgi:hypothetical protein